MDDFLILNNIKFKSRLLTGTGKFSNKDLIPQVIDSTETQIITVALRRVDLKGNEQNILNYIDRDKVTLLPNTSGARNALEAIRIARLARAAGMGNFIKIEVINDQKYLLPDNLETIEATKVLAKEGFVVLPYVSPSLPDMKRLEDAGAAAIMPLGAPIGTNRGLKTKEMLRILIEEATLPIIVDAGIGKPSHAAEAMEMGADAVLVNTGIAVTNNPVLIGKAFKYAVKAGRIAYLNGTGAITKYANASSPLTGFLE